MSDVVYGSFFGGKYSGKNAALPTKMLNDQTSIYVRVDNGGQRVVCSNVHIPVGGDPFTVY